MTKAALYAALLCSALAACGGKTKAAEPTGPVETAREAPPADEAKPAEPAKPAEEAKPDNAGAEALALAALAQQYALGKKVYGDKDCDSCHGDNGEGGAKSPPVIGPKALPEQPLKGAKLRKMPFKTAKDVMDFVKAKMPIKTPGTLTEDEAAAVTAWMLSESKVNITAKLDASNAAAINLR